jgi:hypothetical protein
MLIEDNIAFNRPSHQRHPVWPPDPIFKGASYEERFAIFFDRMIRERLLDAACVVVASKETGNVRFANDTLTFQSFAAAVHGRCLQFKTINPNLDWDD